MKVYLIHFLGVDLTSSVLCICLVEMSKFMSCLFFSSKCTFLIKCEVSIFVFCDKKISIHGLSNKLYEEKPKSFIDH